MLLSFVRIGTMDQMIDVNEDDMDEYLDSIYR